VRRAALATALGFSLAIAAGASAQTPPGPAPLRATILLGPGAPANGVFTQGVPIPITIQIENVSGNAVATNEGFSATDFFRRLYFTDPNGGTITNKIEELIHADRRVFMCLSRGRVLQRQAIPVAPIEVLAGPATPPNFFREFQIADVRTLYDLSRPGRYGVNARFPLQVFSLSDPNAVISNCDQVPGTVANVTAVSGSAAFFVVSNSLEFEVQVPPPQPPTTVASVSPSPGTGGWIRPSATVSFIATPGGAPVQRIVVQTSGAQVGQQVIAAATGSITISADGQTSVAYHAEDAAGGIEAPQVLAVKVDHTPPAVACGAADGLWHPTDVSVACTATDAASGLANTSDADFSLSTSVPAGTETASASTNTRPVCDVAGNCTTAVVGGFRVDRKPPVIVVIAPANGAVYAVGQVVRANYACTDGGSGVKSCTGTQNGAAVPTDSPVDTATAGPKTFTVASRDNVDNAAVPVTATYTVQSASDSTPPVTAAAATPPPNGNNWNNTNVAVRLTATDVGSGVRQITYSTTGAQVTPATVVPGNTATVTLTAEGVTTLTWFAQDNANNYEVARQLTVRIDTTRPTIAGMPAAGCSLWPPDDRMVRIATVTASDALSGLVAGSPSVTATSNEADPGSIVVNGGAIAVRASRLGSGGGRVYTITATAADKAGNTAMVTGTCTAPHDQEKK